MKKSEINGITIYDTEGNNPVIIFIHAFPLCSRQWDKQVEYFKKDFRVITYDIRGLGYSKYDSSYPLMMEDLVDDLLNIISELKLDQVNVCGLSIGGYIILRAIMRSPDLFNSIILANTRAERDTNDVLIARNTLIKQMKKGKKDLFLSQFLKNIISEQSYKNDGIKNFIKEVMSWQSPEGISQVANALATRTETLEELKHINIPALIVASDKDAMTGVEYAERMKENLKNSYLKVMHGAGHLSNIEKPDEFNKCVEDFLMKIPFPKSDSEV
jgi:3-oxoadipate enol-lactonase